MARQRRRHEMRFSVWTFVAPVALVVAAVLVFTVLRDAVDESRHAAASKPTRSATTASAATTARRTEAPPRLYTVKAGDTLSAIAERYGLTVAQIQRLNPSLVPEALQRGQRIRLQ